jgi:predicted DNA-binding transcriptional regulator YafY
MNGVPLSRTHVRRERIKAIFQERRRATADALAAELNVSVRTIYRDVIELQARGFEIQGKGGDGYVLRAQGEPRSQPAFRLAMTGESE